MSVLGVAVSIGLYLLLVPAIGVAHSAAGVTVDKDVKVAMHDGVRLATDVYRPSAPGTYPAILVRTPYDKVGLADDGAFFAQRGYTFVAQDTRGRFSSEGTFEPYVQDNADGLDTALWLNAQPWFNKQQGFGVYGDSYLASTAMSVAEMNPPNLKALHASFASANYHDDGAWRGGAFELAHNVVYTALTACPNVLARARVTRSPLPGGANADALFKLQTSSPLDQPLLSDNCPWYHNWAQNSDENAYWDRPGLNHAAVWDKLPPIPMAFMTGWYDQFLGGTVLNYQAAPADVSLTIGPWVHGQMDSPTAGDGAFGPTAPMDRRNQALHWFNRYLKGSDPEAAPPNSVRYFRMGGGGPSDQPTAIGGTWQTTPVWPPPDAASVAYYLHVDGSLSPDPPARSETPDTYAYDPHDPVPTIGGNVSSGSIFAPAGAFVQRCRRAWPACRDSSTDLTARPDVLAYQTEPLDQDLQVVGPLSVQLWAATSAADTDFTAKLVDVYPNGDAVNVADGIIRARYADDKSEAHLVVPDSPRQYTIDLWHTAMLFKAGHRIRVDISSSNFPQFDRNLNTGNPIGSDVLDNAVVATQTIFHDAVRPSSILLPVLPAE